MPRGLRNLTTSPNMLTERLWSQCESVQRKVPCSSAIAGAPEHASYAYDLIRDLGPPAP